MEVLNKVSVAGFAYILVLCKEYYEADSMNAIAKHAQIVNSQI